MRKIIVLLIVTILLSSCGVNKDLSKLEFTGKFCEKENENNGSKCEGNYVWGAAMNFAWNDLKENILKEDVILDTKNKEALELAKKFNKSIITKDILDKKSYYVKSGYGQKTVDIINKETKKKFPKKSFQDLQIHLKPNDIISYAYFYKAVEYKKPFHKTTVFFKGKSYKGFEASNYSERKNVKILKYENDDKFIIKLNLKDNSDELILAKGYDMLSPEQVVKEIDKYDGDDLKSLEYNDTYHDFFNAPNISLDYKRDYKSLIGKRLLNKVLVEKCRKMHYSDNCYKINNMFENIKFDMDNKGAKVENEAAFVTATIAGYGGKKPEYKERYFYLDDDYWIIMKRKNSSIPYFVLGVMNGNLMKKVKEKKEGFDEGF